MTLTAFVSQGQQGQPGQPGQYPPQQQQYQQGPYGGQPAGPHQVAQYKQLLQAAVQERNLHTFYPPNSPVLDQIASRASAQVDKLCAQWRIPKEVGNDIVKLALYDIYLYIGQCLRLGVLKDPPTESCESVTALLWRG